MLRYQLHAFSDDWIIGEEPVPEAAWHDGCLELFKALLVAWVARSGRNAAVFRDIAILARREHPRIGFNPDVCLVEPAPPGAAELASLRLWEHTPPRLAFEAVTPSHPYKDYAVIPEKCAVAGVTELVVFDPLLAGPRAQGGPWLLQVWQRAPDGGFERAHAGDGPARSSVLDAWLEPNRAARRLRVTAGADGSEPWLTLEQEAQRAEERARSQHEQAREREQQAREREQQAHDREQEAHERELQAMARVAELEAELERSRR